MRWREFEMNVTGFPTLDDTLDVDTSTGDVDRISREKSVRNSIAITEMEGGQPSAYCREQLGLFEAGKISVTEMRDRVVRNASR
jgi:antitoxin VbhA-like protein